jgi:hypothetical protein
MLYIRGREEGITFKESSRLKGRQHENSGPVLFCGVVKNKFQRYKEISIFSEEIPHLYRGDLKRQVKFQSQNVRVYSQLNFRLSKPKHFFTVFLVCLPDVNISFSRMKYSAGLWTNPRAVQ